MRRFWYFTTLILLLFSVKSFTQNNSKNNSYLPNPKYPELFKTIPLINNDSPEWVKLMYSENPNYFKVVEAYTLYYKNHEFKKNTHTQNYRYWNRQIEEYHYYRKDGTIYIPTLEEKRNRERFLKEKYKKYYNRDKGGNWQCIGPFETYDEDGISKKSSQVNIYMIAQAPSDPSVLYAGSEGGGLFKSTDKALHWTPIGEYLSLGGIEALEVDPTNKNVVYMASLYDLYKTTDGGVTWTSIESQYKNYIKSISINPNNHNIILTAGNKGLKRSTDGGTTWTTISTNRAWDIKLKTDDPNTVFVAIENPSKKITEIWKSTDAGATFTPKTNGWYQPVGGVAASTDGARIGVTNADPNRIYVVLLGEENDTVNDNNYIGIYRSDDAGESWSTPYDGDGDGHPDNEPGGPYSQDHWCLTSFSPYFSWGGFYNQGFYDLDIAVSDSNPDKFLVGSLNLFKSDDGGVTYKGWGGYVCDNCGSGYRHPDVQDIDINGNDVWVATDGGLDLYDANFNYVDSYKNGISGSAYWGFGQGWNEDVVTGGRYHNGNSAHYENYSFGYFLELGGGEAPTGYVNQGENRKVYHSDIKGKELPVNFTGGIKDIPKYAMFPNESYISNRKSEIVTDPRSWQTLYLGKDNKIWKSDNGGSSFNEVHTFGTTSTDIVLGIEIPRSNPDVIYAVQRIVGGGKVWKTTDGGDTWTALHLPDSTTEMYISVKGTDENVLYLALDNGYTSNSKIYKTTDGGNTWTNLSDPIFDGEWPKGIQMQYGTNDGVYVITDKKVYYKNNSIGWQLFSNGLPGKIKYKGFIPFYRDGKVRLATSNRGIWESPFYEPSQPVAQPMVNTTYSYCPRDTVKFENYSVSLGNATYNWSFSPSPEWVSSTTARNPKVKFGNPGNYSATLTVTDSNGSDTKTVNNIVTITSECDAEPVPGKALSVDGASNSVAVVPPLNLNSNRVTISAWIKRDGDQNSYAGIVFCRGTNTTAGLNFRNNNELGYHWDRSNYTFSSGFYPPDGVWTHVALVIEPDKATIYMNGEAAVNNKTHNPEEFDDNLLIGGDTWSSRKFKGLIDEVCIYDTSLSQTEIRQLMYKTKSPSSLPHLIHYYQFNRDSGTVTDRVAIAHAVLTGNASRSVSTAPVPYNTITDGNWYDSTVWNIGQNIPVKNWARVKVENDIHLNRNKVLKGLEITPSGKLVVKAGKKLSINGPLVNNSGIDGLILKADSSGTASLMHQSSNVEATVESYISQNKWHFISAPINNAVSGVFMGIYMIIFDETNYTWQYITDPDYDLTEGKGFVVWSDSATTGNTTVSYEGILNTGNLTVNGFSYTPSQPLEDRGWNIIGNPYPSSVHLDYKWTRNDVDATAYIYDGANYLTWNFANNSGTHPNGDVAPGQGFWIKANSSNASITIPQIARKHSSQQFYKLKDEHPDRLMLDVKGNGYSDKMIVEFNKESTPYFDSELDAWKFKGKKDAPQLYSVYSGEKLTVNVLPFENQTMIIPVSFEAGTENYFTIKASGIESFSDDTEIILEDLKSEKMIDLKSNPSYTFYASPYDMPDRFVLHFTRSIVDTPENPDGNLNIFSFGNRLFVVGSSNENGIVKVYNLMGEEIKNVPIKSNVTTIPFNGYKSTYYIVVVNRGNRATSKKVFIE